MGVSQTRFCFPRHPSLSDQQVKHQAKTRVIAWQRVQLQRSLREPFQNSAARKRHHDRSHQNAVEILANLPADLCLHRIPLHRQTPMHLGLLNERFQGRKNGLIGFPEQEVLEENRLGKEGDHFRAMSCGNARRDLALDRQRVSDIAAVPAGSFFHPAARSQKAECHSQVAPVPVRLFHDLIEPQRVRRASETDRRPCGREELSKSE